MLPVEKVLNNTLVNFKDNNWLLIKEEDKLIKLKQLKDEEKLLKDELIKIMEELKIKSFENDFLKISYTAPTTRTDFDKDKFKTERPKVYEKYLKTISIGATVRITLKDK